MESFDDPEIYRGVLDSVDAGIYLVDCDRRILFWNAGAERITGYLRQDMLGRSCKDDFLGHVDSRHAEITGDATPLAIVLREGRSIKGEISLRHKSGHRVLVRLRAAPLRGSNGKVIGAVESFQEIIPVADWNRRHDKLAEYGCLDSASGLLNHGMVESHLREMLATFAEHPIPFSILCLGIDQLDQMKTHHGPGALALVLRAVGQTLENCLRPTDFIGRWKENEFLAILSECNGNEVPSVGDRLGKMVHQSRIEWWGDMLSVTISMGAADAQSGDTVQKMIQRAEYGLRQSIANGGNQLTRSSKLPDQGSGS
jgi:diguanylate cyclase (GGDEF)-like protein/PAS domain S-box-containing protein